MAEKFDEAGTKVLSLISHKFRTPLSIINGYSDALINQKHAEKMSAFGEKAVEEIHKQGNHLTYLVDRLIRFTKVEETATKDIVKTPLNLKTLVKAAALEVLEDAPGHMEERGDVITKGPVTLEISCPGDFSFMGDENLVSAAVKELISNAVKFNLGANKNINIYCQRHNNNVSLSVKDNGSGIRPGEINKIFDKFYQIDEYFTGQIEGWGLGLPFVKKVMELHGGMVSVVSDKGLGSVFTLTLAAN